MPHVRKTDEDGMNKGVRSPDLSNKYASVIRRNILFRFNIACNLQIGMSAKKVFYWLKEHS